MTFYKTDCPECCERILLDVINGYGYCMYCGAKVEPQDLIPIQNALREAISIEIEKEDENNPWNKPIAEGIKMAQSGDIDGCIEKLRSAITDADKNELDDVEDDINRSIIDWIVCGISDENVPLYNGGAKKIYDGLDGLIENGMDGVIPNVCQMHIAVISTNIHDPDKAKRLITVAFMLFRDKVESLSNADELMDFLSAIRTSCRNVFFTAYPDDNKEEEYSKEMAFRYYGFIAHLMFMISQLTRDLKRKELVKVNRLVSAADRTEALISLDKAMDSLSDNLDEYFEPMCEYASFMAGKTLKNKKKA